MCPSTQGGEGGGGGGGGRGGDLDEGSLDEWAQGAAGSGVTEVLARPRSGV